MKGKNTRLRLPISSGWTGTSTYNKQVKTICMTKADNATSKRPCLGFLTCIRSPNQPKNNEDKQLQNNNIETSSLA